MLTSLRCSVPCPVVFRHFGFAVATVTMKFALAAQRVINAGLGVVATPLTIAPTWIYNRVESRE